MSTHSFQRMIKAALREDIGRADRTTELTVPADATCRARLVAKQDGVLSGITIFRAVFKALGLHITDWQSLNDGDGLESGGEVAQFRGEARRILTGERTALNFVQRLSGVATTTRAYVDAIAGTNARICDTRKTTPGMRVLEKSAVLHGGGRNHRHTLDDGILVKENHIAAAGGITAALNAIRPHAHHLMRIEIEVTSLPELDEALAAGADVVLLDNFDLETTQKAVGQAKDSGVLLEASGGITLDNVRAIAETGVDFISIGALTHSAPAVDLSLLIDL